MGLTTIQISTKTRERLSRLKGRETYEDLIGTLLELVPSSDNEGQYTEEFKESLLRSLGDIKNGRTHSLEDVRRKLGLRA